MLIRLEKLLYNSLSDSELIRLLQEFDEEIPSKVTDRCKKRLNIMNKVARGQNANDEEIFEAIIIIKALILMNLRISKLSKDEQLLLLTYYEGIKINYLTSKPFLEMLALKYNFNLLKIQEVLQQSNYNIINFQTHIIFKILELFERIISNNQTGNSILDTIIVGINMSQIEVLLDYLNKDSLYHLSNYIEKHNDNKELTLIVKRLILKRKNKEDI